MLKSFKLKSVTSEKKMSFLIFSNKSRRKNNGNAHCFFPQLILWFVGEGAKFVFFCCLVKQLERQKSHFLLIFFLFSLSAKSVRQKEAGCKPIKTLYKQLKS